LAEEPRKDRTVVLISIDGLAAYYFDDPLAQMPTLRALAKEGARATGMTCSFPTVTWPNHTTLATGVPPAKHGVLGNNYLDRETAKPVPLLPDPLFDKAEIVKSPTIYDAAHGAGLTTAGVIWPATRNAKTLDWTVPDMALEDAWPKYGTPSWIAELRAAGLPVEKHPAWCKDNAGGGVRRDWLYSRLAAHVLEHHAPNLLMVHLIEVDHVEHQYGPKTPEAYWAVSHADDRLKDIVEATRRSAHGQHATFVVVSDHGFYAIDKEIRPNVLFKQQQKSGGEKPIAKAVSQGGGCMAYVLDAARKSELVSLLRDQLKGIEGVDAVYEPQDFGKLGQLGPSADPRAPDLWLAAKEGYSFTDSDAGDDVVVPKPTPGGTHGYLPEQAALYATLVLSGDGVRPGVNLGQVSNQDVAPTMARLLGVPFPSADGKVLDAALTGK
jgi:predicted AlkP superfamily pyrophosphatase or phosphodiesterase